MKLLLLLLLALPMIGFGQNVNIPNGIFKAYLVNNTAINTNGDYEIQVSEASVFNGGINLYAGPGSGFGLGEGITDLTGIEAFVSLTSLVCSWNQLSSLNLSACTALTYLNCFSNYLTSLDVSANTALTTLYCYGNNLTSLDVSNNTALTGLDCSYNQLTSLDVRNGNNTNFYGFGTINNPNLTCINVDDATWSTANWIGNNFDFDSQHYFSNNCSGTTSIQELNTNKKLLKVTDLLGRETKATNQVLIHIYDDGTLEKKIVFE